MIPSHHPTGKCSAVVVRAMFALCLAALSCSGTPPTVLICKDASGRGMEQSWVLKVDASERTAEMVVHVPAESIAGGTPAGNRLGTALISERAYDITIPSDSGGSGSESWVRLQFQFEIDRYTGLGTLWIGEEKHGERPMTKLSCESGRSSPRL